MIGFLLGVLCAWTLDAIGFHFYKKRMERRIDRIMARLEGM